MSDMKIPHSFSPLERAIGEGGPKEISKKELAMLHAAGNVNLISGAIPNGEEITYTDEPTNFSTEGTQTPEEEAASEIGEQVLGLVKQSEGGGAAPG